RIGPDKGEEDKWRKSRILAYGKAWEEEFESLVNKGVSRKNIALTLDVSLKTVYNRIALQKTSPELTGKYRDRKSTRLNSSHVSISYAVFCLKKKIKKKK